jgi:hypothetical protein
MKFLLKFPTESDYEITKKDNNWETPNVSLIEESNVVKYCEYIKPPISLCDIAYYDGNTVKTVSKNKWSASLGTPIGVVVIPEGMVPDGKARIISLTGKPRCAWDEGTIVGYDTTYEDTPLVNYNACTNTKNDGTGAILGSFGYFPSDNFTGTQSIVDPNAKYAVKDEFIPSPYLGDNKTFNAEYNTVFPDSDNILTDFDGFGNTQTLLNFSNTFRGASIAPYEAWNYTDGVSQTQWYLPTIAELGFLVARFKTINETLNYIGATTIPENAYIWASNEGEYKYPDIAWRVTVEDGEIAAYSKYAAFYTYPFAML